VSASDPDAERLEILERWERAAGGWGKRAGRVRELGMPVSLWMIEHLELQPGERALELAAGPGDTGFLAAEAIQPGGTLLCSDGSEAMLEIARARAREFGIDNAEFARLELEWIDLPTASVDAILCRWGLMLSVDPASAMREARRVLRPGGRIALAVWDDAALNPWATIPGRSLESLGFAEALEPGAPGMFSLAAPGRIREMLHSAGFIEPLVEAVELERRHPSVESYLEETLDLSRPFAEVFQGLSEPQQAEVEDRIASLLAPFVQSGGSVSLPGRSLVALASA
jgi:ubiquinone/menaquinone biosynthesis C-methylase UbiE